ncbi:hypothetical protein D3C87_2196570 [compost metagenome]
MRLLSRKLLIDFSAMLGMASVTGLVRTCGDSFMVGIFSFGGTCPCAQPAEARRSKASSDFLMR